MTQQPKPIITIERKCNECKGTGYPADARKNCKSCKGTGQSKTEIYPLNEKYFEKCEDWENVECPDCEEGYSYHDCGDDTCCCINPKFNVTCYTCNGESEFQVHSIGFKNCSGYIIPKELEPYEIKKVSDRLNEFEKELAREINYTYMPRDEYTYRAEVKDRFMMSLLETDKVVLVNKISANI